MNDEELAFSDALKQLQIIVESLEEESISLEEGLKLMEKGRMLYKLCKQRLDEAKIQVKKLFDDDSQLEPHKE